MYVPAKREILSSTPGKIRTGVPSERSQVRLRLAAQLATVTMAPKVGSPEGSNVFTCVE